jgi:hypothetical protein
VEKDLFYLVRDLGVKAVVIFLCLFEGLGAPCLGKNVVANSKVRQHLLVFSTAVGLVSPKGVVLGRERAPQGHTMAHILSRDHNPLNKLMFFVDTRGHLIAVVVCAVFLGPACFWITRTHLRALWTLGLT